MDSGRELIEALSMVSQERGIDKEVIFEAIEASLVSACKKQFGLNTEIRVVVDRETGAYTVMAKKTIVEIVEDEEVQISLKDARTINNAVELGDEIEIIVTPKNFGRISAQTAKQVVTQKFREAEREILYNEFITKENEMVTAVVQRQDRRNVIVSLGRLEANLIPSEQIPRERYNFSDRIKVYISEVKQNSKGPIVNISRTHPELLKRLFEQEVPEIYDGTVEIKAIAREPGSRSKVAVYSAQPNVDPIGACVGQSGHRVNLISSELRGERLDIIQWSEDPATFISSALSPSKVVQVVLSPYENAAKVVVPDTQLSLAIGKEGQNARLAARLTGWSIDIKSESQVEGTDFLVFPVVERPVEEAYEDGYYYEDGEYYEEEGEYYEDGEYYEEEGEYYEDEYYDDEYYEYYDPAAEGEPATEDPPPAT
ncbi:MAG: transcription termination factor NusA [Defluviitaleaceae bacterium]|nr:transcription termination factor NusA [Defluviitaleaceae bacterium]